MTSVHLVPQHRPTHQCHHLGVDERDRLTQVHGEGGVHQPTLLIESNNWGCEGRRRGKRGREGERGKVNKERENEERE